MQDLSPAPADLAGARLGFSFIPTIGSGTVYTLQVGVYPPCATPVTLSRVSDPGTMTGTLTGTTDATTGEVLLSASFDRAGTYEIEASSPEAASRHQIFRVAGNVHWTVEPSSTTGGAVQSPTPTVTLIDATGAVDTTNHDDVVVHTSSAS